MTSVSSVASFRLVARVLLVLIACAFPACRSGEGPLLINVSGKPADLAVYSENGDVERGTCGDQAAVWLGKSGSATARVEIVLDGVTYVLEGDELHTRFGKDRATAFVIESTGPRKLELREAEVLMRNRPEIHRPR